MGDINVQRRDECNRAQKPGVYSVPSRKVENRVEASIFGPCKTKEGGGVTRYNDPKTGQDEAWITAPFVRAYNAITGKKADK